jgi:hypothetical protein
MPIKIIMVDQKQNQSHFDDELSFSHLMSRMLIAFATLTLIVVVAAILTFGSSIAVSATETLEGEHAANAPITDVEWVKHTQQQGTLTLKIPAKKAAENTDEKS